jgi:hypothetical protein
MPEEEKGDTPKKQEQTQQKEHVKGLGAPFMFQFFGFLVSLPPFWFSLSTFLPLPT